MAAACLPNYALYVLLSEESRRAVEEFQKSVGIAPSSGPAHVTVAYGPSLQPGEAQETEPDALRAMYGNPDFLPHALRFCGIACFRRPHRSTWVVHVNVTSEQLQQLRGRALAALPAVAARCLEEHAALLEAGVHDDASYLPGSTTWSHITLAVVSSESEAASIMAEAKAFPLLASARFEAQRLAAVTATSDMLVEL